MKYQNQRSELVEPLHMRYVETLSRSIDNRLVAKSKKKLHSKVANSTQPEHRGYPDETGYVPHIAIDPKHTSLVDSDANLCVADNSNKSTVFTACLAFPHLPLGKHTRGRLSIQKLVSTACVDASEVFDEFDDTLQEVLRERERMRMRAIVDGHDYAMGDDMVLTADPEEKILINAYRAAAQRTEGEPSADDVRNVITFKRNRLQRFLSFPVENLTDEQIQTLVSEKTCAPVIPKTDDHKTVLLYWLDNPSASLREVIEETGIPRGRFETFRLNLPELSCYNRSYIESLQFNKNELTETLHEYMIESPHDVYSCADCKTWSYSRMSLSNHKKHSSDHDTAAVTADEEPTNLSRTEAETDIQWDNSGVTVEDMLANVSTTPGEQTDELSTEEPTEASEPEEPEEQTEGAEFEFVKEEDLVEPPASPSEQLNEEPEFSLTVLCDVLGVTEQELLDRFLTTLTEDERSRLEALLDRERQESATELAAD